MNRLMTGGACFTAVLLLAASGVARAVAAETPAPDRAAYLEAFRAGPAQVINSSAPSRQRYLRDLRGDEDTPSTPAPAPSDSRPNTVVITSEKPSTSAPASSGWVPPGFEELLEPQTTVVDVFYGGAFLVSTPATFTPTEITFLDPQAIVDRIPDLLEPEAIATVLGGEMSTNAELVCLNQRNPACGTIETDTADVIFDDAQFRADLFVSPELLTVRSAVASRFLPRSSAGWSLLNTTSATINGAERESTNYNLGNSTTLAWRENRLIGVSNLTNDDDLTFDTLALQREINGQQIQGGIFRSSPGNLVFLRQEDYQGLSIASSIDTRQDLDQSAGAALQVFLDSRSRVDIFKDGRLVSTAVYDTGNQILDTSQLPGGAYEITLRIRDSFGNEREESRFYVKTNRLPPIDQPLYFLDIGETVAKEAGRTLPSGTGERFLRAGYARRLSDSFGGEVGVFSNEDESLLEAGIFQLARRYELRLNAAVGSDDSQGLSLNGRTRIGSATINGNLRQIWTDRTDSLIGSELTQATFNFTLPLGRSSVSVTGRYNDRESGTDRNVGVRYDFPTRRFGQSILTANLQMTRNNDDLQILLAARLSLRSGRWQTQATARAYSDRREGRPDDDGIATEIASTWQDGDRYLSDVSFSVRANDGQIDRTLESELDVTASLGRGTLEAVYSDERQRLSWGGSLYTSIIATPGTFAIGARQQGQSAVVLDIAGDEDDAYFDVEINGTRRGTAAIGDKTVIGLTPFDTYEVKLKPRGSTIIDFEQNTRSVTLYPGNVVSMDWSVTRVIVAFGQIVNEAGEPVANGVVDGVIGLAITDEFGLFQAEFNSDVKSLNVRTREGACEVDLPDYDASQMVVTLGELVCR